MVQDVVEVQRKGQAVATARVPSTKAAAKAPATATAWTAAAWSATTRASSASHSTTHHRCTLSFVALIALTILLV